MFCEPKVQLCRSGAATGSTGRSPVPPRGEVAERVVTSRPHNAYRPIAAAARGRHTRSGRAHAPKYSGKVGKSWEKQRPWSGWPPSRGGSSSGPGWNPSGTPCERLECAPGNFSVGKKRLFSSSVCFYRMWLRVPPRARDVFLSNFERARRF